MWTTFYFTHNYVFFNLLKDEFKRTKRCDFENRKNHACKALLYQIERNATNARLKNLDCLLCKFKSEYQYIFYKICQFKNMEDLDDEYKLYTMPNLLRRFLDTYLGFHYPSGNNLRENLGHLIIDPNEKKFVHKVINELSHSENIERSFKFYTTDEIKQAVGIIFKAFEESSVAKTHLKELKKSIGFI